MYAALEGAGGFYDADLGANIPTTGDIDFCWQLTYSGLYWGLFVTFGVGFLFFLCVSYTTHD